METKRSFQTLSILWAITFWLAVPTLSQVIDPGPEDPNLKEEAAPQSVTAQAAAGIVSQGGPDEGGYYYFDNREPQGPAFDWIEISGTGTNLNLRDDSHFFPIVLPFNFDFYGTNYNQVGVGSNGAIYFEDRRITLGNQCIPGANSSGILCFIAVYWDDLKPLTESPDNIYYQIVGDAPNRRLIVQWQRVAHYGAAANTITAQAHLFEDGNILLLYADPSTEAGSGGTVGIQNDPETGLQYLCNESGLSAGLAVLFTRDCQGHGPHVPENPLPADGAENVPVNTSLQWNRRTANSPEQTIAAAPSLEALLEQGMVHEIAEDPNLKEDCDAAVLTAPAPSVAASIGGPDAGGYYYLDNQEPGGPDFDWVEISTNGTNLNLSDDSYFYPVNLPFNFDFYGTHYNQIAVGSNGGVYFQDAYLPLGNGCIPASYTIDRFIALYWDDLYPTGSGNVYYRIVGNAPNRRLIVQWQNVMHCCSSSGGFLTAQVQLHENGDILLLYANPSLEAGQSGTVGIQNDAQTGLQYLCNETRLSAGLAVLFTRNPQGPDTAIYDVYLGTDMSQMELVGSDLEEPELQPCPLDYETTYFWQVIARNECGLTEGPIWSFTTEPWQPLPENGATDVPIDTLLEWNGGICDGSCGIENGGFESGQFDPWVAVTGPGQETWPWEVTNLYPYLGNYHAMNGFEGDAGLFYDLYQEVVIPRCAPQAIFSWSEFIYWESPIGTLPREYTVSIQPAGGGEPLAVVYSQQIQPGTFGGEGYVTHTVDLLELNPSITGQTVRINFHQDIPESFTGFALLLLDNISLTCGDPVDLDTGSTYDVYLGTDMSGMERVASDLQEPALRPCLLEYETTYYWQVIMKNDCRQTASPICSFTTEPWQTLPEDNATDVPINTLLEWVGPSSSGGGGGNCDESCGLINGGFETGDFTPWVAVAGIGDQLTEWNIGIGNRGYFENGFPFEGILCAQNGFDGEAGLYYDLYQETAIPACASSAILTWSDRIQWDMYNFAGSTLPRQYTVSIQPAGGGAPIATVHSMQFGPSTMGDTGYVTHSVDLLDLAPALAGQTVRINFHEFIPENFTGPAQFELDGISLTCGGQAAAVEPHMINALALNPTQVETLVTDYEQIRQAALDAAEERRARFTYGQSEPQQIPSPVSMDAPAAAPSAGRIINGDFETGTLEGWTLLDTPNGFVLNDGSLDPPGPDGLLPPYHGNFSVLSQQTGGGIRTLYQDVSLPADAETVTLRWADMIRNHHTAFVDPDQEYRVQIWDLNNHPLATLFSTNPGNPLMTSWTERSADISAFAGQIVRIAFSEEDHLWYFNVHLDDIRIETDSPPPPTGPVAYDVYLGTDMSQMEQVGFNLNEPSFKPCILDYETTYYWQVVIKVGCGSVETPIHSFTTQAWQPQPGNGVIQVPIDTLLEWNGPVNEALAAAPSVQQIADGDFETGTLSSWGLLNSSTYGTFVINNGTLDPEGPDGPLPPYSGGFSALCRHVGPGTYTLYQDVTLPTDMVSITLLWADMIRNHATGFVDPTHEYRVQIWNLNNQPLAALFSTNPGNSLTTGWTERSADITSFAGQTVRIAFTVELSLSFFNVHLDNIRIESEAPPPEESILYDVYFGTEPGTPDAWALIGQDHDTPVCDPTPEADAVLQKGTVYSWQVIAKNTCGSVSSPIWSFMTENTPPVAVACEDQTVFCWIDGVAHVTLDGSGSYDADGHPITYLWTWTVDGQSHSAADATPTLTLPPGVHTITLVVNDGIEDSGPEEVVVTAEAPVQVSVKFTPRSLNCESNGQWIKVHCVMPQDCQITDLNTAVGCTLEPLGLPEDHMNTFINEDGRLELEIAFGRDAFCDADMPLGFNPVTLAGSLTSGHYFYGNDSIRIMDNKIEHLVNVASNWLREDCTKPKWCDGLDVNADGVVDLKDLAAIE